MENIERSQLEVDYARENKKTEKNRDKGSDKIGAPTRKEEGSAIEAVGQGTKENWIEHAFADFTGDLEVVVGGGADCFDDEKNGVVGE
jgi:hypothetical protein